MAISQQKMLQFLRGGEVLANRDAAVEGIKGLQFPSGVNFDGTPVVGRYYNEDGEIKSVYGIFHNMEQGTGVTIFDNVDETKSDLKTIIESVGLNDDGTYKPSENSTYISSALTVLEATEMLDAAIVANKVDSEDKSIIVSATDEGTDLSVNIDNETIVIAENGVLSADKSLVYVPAEKSELSGAYFTLVNAIGEEEGEPIMVSDLIANGLLKSATYDKETGILTLVFSTASGKDEVVKVNLADMLDIDDVIIGDDSQDYLKVTLVPTPAEGDDKNNMVLDALMKEISAATEEETGLVDAWDAKQAIAKATTTVEHDTDAKNLIVEETTDSEDGHTVYTVIETGLTPAQDGEFISTEFTVAENLAAIDSALSESITEVIVNDVTGEVENHTVTVVISGTDINVGAATGVEYPEEFEEKVAEYHVGADTTVAEAFANLETVISALTQELLDDEETASSAITALAIAAGVLNDNDEIGYIVNEEATYINVATSLADADNILDEAIKELSGKVESTQHTVVVDVDSNPVKAVTETETTEDGAEYDKVTVTLKYADVKETVYTNEEECAGLVTKMDGDEGILDVSFDFGTW